MDVSTGDHLFDQLEDMMGSITTWTENFVELLFKVQDVADEAHCEFIKKNRRCKLVCFTYMNGCPKDLLLNFLVQKVPTLILLSFQ